MFLCWQAPWLALAVLQRREQTRGRTCTGKGRLWEDQQPLIHVPKPGTGGPAHVPGETREDEGGSILSLKEPGAEGRSFTSPSVHTLTSPFFPVEPSSLFLKYILLRF